MVNERGSAVLQEARRARGRPVSGQFGRGAGNALPGLSLTACQYSRGISNAMPSPSRTSKKTVDLAEPVVRVSRIRRDPPPPEKIITAAEIREHDTRTLVIGVAILSLALFVALIGVVDFAGWMPREYLIGNN